MSYLIALFNLHPDGFGANVKTETLRKVAAEFRTFADDARFIACDAIEP